VADPKQRNPPRRSGAELLFQPPHERLAGRARPAAPQSRQRGGRWYCAEVFSARSFGYGTYTFTSPVASTGSTITPSWVCSLGTTTRPPTPYREIDIELSRWGERRAKNAQYVVQPWQHAGNEHRFNFSLGSLYSTHSFRWSADRVLFSSSRGRSTSSARPPDLDLQRRRHPAAGAGHARINLWLVDGKPPANGRSVEIVVKSFHFVPEA